MADVLNCGPEFHLIWHLEYTSKSNTEFQDYFMFVRMIFFIFRYIENLWQGNIKSENM